jgi:hypothetical protein
MTKPDTLIVDGHVVSWQRLRELRRQQLEQWKAAQPSQPALFELKNDCRSAADRTASARYQEPTLFAEMTGGSNGSRTKTFTGAV